MSCTSSFQDGESRVFQPCDEIRDLGYFRPGFGHNWYHCGTAAAATYYSCFCYPGWGVEADDVHVLLANVPVVLSVFCSACCHYKAGSLPLQDCHCSCSCYYYSCCCFRVNSFKYRLWTHSSIGGRLFSQNKALPWPLRP